MGEADSVSFRVGDHALQIVLDAGSETVWASQAQIAEIFGCSRRNVSDHIKTVFDSGEIDNQATWRKIRQV